MKNQILNSNILILLICVNLYFAIDSNGQNCPFLSTYCSDAPLNCALNLLNNSSCSLVPFANYSGDRCNEACWGTDENTVHYAFMSNGEPFTITMTTKNCVQDNSGYKAGLQIGVTTDCCSGFISSSLCAGFPPDPLPPVYSVSISGKLTACQIYYLTIDGYEGSYCDYTLSVTGGAANVPLVLKNINDVPNNIINLTRGTCGYKFKVEPRDAPCEGYYEWTIDGAPVDDHDREIVVASFPDEGDFQICVFGYIGLPNFNCGQSAKTCTTVKVRQEHRTGIARVLCNEQKGIKWFKQSINSSGFYNQLFQEPCITYDSTVEFTILPKPQPGIVNYISCSKSDPYFDPIYKEFYRKCTNNKRIFIPKSTDVYACDSSYLLNVAYVDLQNKMHLTCKNGNIYMIPEITNYTDTCRIGVEMSFEYSWYEKTNNGIQFLTHVKELKITKKGNYELQVITNYKLQTETGNCIVVFDEDIDEDAYLMAPNTGLLNGKIQVCKGDQECYTISDIVRNPFSFNWSLDQGVIVTPNPDKSNKICVIWDKNSTSTKGSICVTYSDSCSSNLKACLDIEFGKSQKDIAGPDQAIKGALGTQMNGKGSKGLWTYAGGPGTVLFTDPSDPKTRVRVSRFGSYIFKWTILEGGCETYGFVTINFYIKFPEAEGENLLSSFTDVFIHDLQTNYINEQLNIQGEISAATIIKFQIVNIQGQILYANEMETTDSKFIKNISLLLNPGMYYLILENNTQHIINKFIVL